MQTEIIIGICIIICSVGFLGGIVVWSRKAIDRIAESSETSARAIHVSGSTRILKNK